MRRPRSCRSTFTASWPDADDLCAQRLAAAAAPGRHAVRAVFLKHLEKIWEKPDEGIWEIRGAPQHFVHSKAMAWVAFDRAAHSDGPKRSRAHWKKIADRIHAEVCARGVDKRRGCFVQAYGSDHIDASLLLLPIVGFRPRHRQAHRAPRCAKSKRG